MSALLTLRPAHVDGYASESHESDRPIQITWRLHHPLPGDIFAAYRAAVA